MQHEVRNLQEKENWLSEKVMSLQYRTKEPNLKFRVFEEKTENTMGLSFFSWYIHSIRFGVRKCPVINIVYKVGKANKSQFTKTIDIMAVFPVARSRKNMLQLT